MKKENVKIGMMVELTEDYGHLLEGEVYKILRCQSEGSSCFIVEHNGDESYLAPYCTYFKPYKNSVDMKKHEIIKYAYENYPKGTKFKGVASDEEFVSNGSFVFGVDVVNYVSSGYNPNSLLNDPVGLVHDADTGTWATIVTEEKPKELEVGGNNGDNNFLIFEDGVWTEMIEQPKEKYYAIMKGVQDSYYPTEIFNTKEELMKAVNKLSKRDNSSLHSINQFPINN